MHLPKDINCRLKLDEGLAMPMRRGLAGQAGDLSSPHEIARSFVAISAN